jgi:hypothetical protein
MRLADAFGSGPAPELAEEIVSLITGAPDRLRTLRGTIRDWSNPRLIARSLGNPWSDSTSESETVIWRVWFELPTSPFDDLETPRRVRVEKMRGGVLQHRAVRDDDQWWMWSRDEPSEPAKSSDNDLWLHVLAPTWTFSESVVESGRPAWLGREAIELHDPAGTTFLGPAASAARYYVDAERGVLLRAEAEVDGEPAAVEEFIDIAFDEELDPALFAGATTMRTISARKRLARIRR